MPSWCSFFSTPNRFNYILQGNILEYDSISNVRKNKKLTIE